MSQVEGSDLNRFDSIPVGKTKSRFFFFPLSHCMAVTYYLDISRITNKLPFWNRNGERGLFFLIYSFSFYPFLFMEIFTLFHCSSKVSHLNILDYYHTKFP